MAKNVSIRTYLPEKTTFQLSITDLRNFEKQTEFNSQKEFIKYILELLEYVLSERYNENEDKSINWKHVARSVAYFKETMCIDFLNSSPLLNKYFKNNLKSRLNILFKYTEKLLRYCIDNKEQKDDTPEPTFLYNEVVILIDELAEFLKFWKTDKTKENLFEKSSKVFVLTETYGKCDLTLDFKKNSRENIEIYLSEEDQKVLKSFCDQLSSFKKHIGSNPIKSNVFVKSNKDMFVCTILGETIEDFEKPTCRVIKIDDDTIINLSKNRNMYHILEKMLNGKEYYTTIFNKNIEEKINAFNFYYQNPDIIDLYIKNNRQKLYKEVALGKFFNNITFASEKCIFQKAIDTLILANPSEIDKIKDKLNTENIITHIFFTEKAIEHFCRHCLKIPCYTDTVKLEIYPGKGKLKNKMMNFTKKFNL